MRRALSAVALGLLLAACLPAAALASPWLGYYVSSPVPANLAAAEAAAGTRARVSLTFQGPGYFAAGTVADAKASGHVPLYTLELWDWARGTAQPEWDLASFARGDHDPFLREWAAAAKASGTEIWLRPFHEMNGDWYPWCGTVNGNAPEDFVPAWRHVVDTVRSAGADNVRFVWSPNAESVPATPANAIAAYWPGDAWVDYAALDGYNFGTPWRSFSSVFGRPYAVVSALTARPLLVAETGCSAAGGDKAAWVADMFRTVPASFPRLAGVVWFETAKERDWRFGSDAASLAAWRTGAAAWASPGRVATRLPGTGRLSGRRDGIAVAGRLLAGSRGLAGQPVRLERYAGGRWVLLRAGRTGAGGSYSLRASFATAGTRRLRVRYAGTARYAPAVRGLVAVLR